MGENRFFTVNYVPNTLGVMFSGEMAAVLSINLSQHHTYLMQAGLPETVNFC